MTERILTKIGTGWLFSEGPDFGGYVLRPKQMDLLVRDIYETSREHEVIVVTSGAIATATDKTKYKLPGSVRYMAVLSAIGQPKIMEEYAKRFEKYDVEVAQILITNQILDINKRGENLREQRRNLRGVLEICLSEGIVPIFNENDAVVTSEISYGDNDILAANVAVAMDVDYLIMFSRQVEGAGKGGENSKLKAKEICESHEIGFGIINDDYTVGEDEKFESLISRFI
jgi:glutamate 5-kinase